MKYKHFEKSQKKVKTSQLQVLLRQKILQIEKGYWGHVYYFHKGRWHKKKKNESKFILIHQNRDMLPKQRRIRKLKKTKTVVVIQKGKCNTAMLCITTPIQF